MQNMTTEELQDAIIKGIDQLAAENKLGNLSTQIIARYSGISEGKMLRHIPSLDKIISKWLKEKEAEMQSFVGSFPSTEPELINHINALLDQSHIATLLISSAIDQLIDTDNLKKIRKQFNKAISDSISKLESLPNRPLQELTNELMFYLKEIVETSNDESRRKRKTISKNLPWNAEDDLFPDQEILKRLATSESGFVFDPVSGRSYTANDSAVAILKILQETSDIGSITDKVVDEFDVTRGAAERDILEFAGKLRGLM